MLFYIFSSCFIYLLGAGVRNEGQVLYLRDIQVVLNPDSILRAVVPILLTTPIDVDLGELLSKSKQSSSFDDFLEACMTNIEWESLFSAVIFEHKNMIFSCIVISIVSNVRVEWMIACMYHFTLYFRFVEDMVRKEMFSFLFYWFVRVCVCVCRRYGTIRHDTIDMCSVICVIEGQTGL